jgi:hypothetical protein
MQGPRGDEVLQGLDGYEQMVEHLHRAGEGLLGVVGPAGRSHCPRGRCLGGNAARVRPVAAAS